MEEMISNYANMMEMGKRAREVAFEKFDIQKIAQQYQALLIETLNKN